MRTLIFGGAALLLLAAAPTLTNYHQSVRRLSSHQDNSRISPLQSIRALYFNHNRGNSLRRLHPEQTSNISIPILKSPAVACSSTAADTSLNGQWYLQPVLSSDTAAGSFPSLRFNLKNKTFNGHTGCNTISGSFSITDSTLHFNDNVRLTKKVCTGYNEAAFLKNLFMSNRYTIEDSVMTLWFDQTELSRWTRKPQKQTIIKKA